MNDFYQFYYTILSSLPFSINGHADLEEEINKLLSKVINTDPFSKDNKVNFISYSYGKLSSIDRWIVKAFSDKIFFYSHKEIFNEIILSAYLYFIKKINPSQSTTFLTANILSDLFIEDISFKIGYIDSGHYGFYYDRMNKGFVIEIPFSDIFIDDQESVNMFIREFISQAISIHSFELLVKGHGKKSGFYEINPLASIGIKDFENKEAGKQYHKLFNSIFAYEKSGILENLIVKVQYFHKKNPGFFINDNIEYRISRWVNTFVPLIFISFVYNCWIEYFPASCAVFKLDNAKRNLGGFIVGYQRGEDLSRDNRVKVKLLSDRITYNIAANIMHEYLPTSIVSQASECFGSSEIRSITHGGYSSDSIKAESLIKITSFMDQISRFENLTMSQINFEYKQNVHKFYNALIDFPSDHDSNVPYLPLKEIRDQHLQYKIYHIKNNLTNLAHENGWNILFEEFNEETRSLFELFICPIGLLEAELKYLFSSLFLKGIPKYLGINVLYSTLVTLQDELFVNNYLVFFHEKNKIIDINDIPESFIKLRKKISHSSGEFIYAYEETSSIVFCKLEENLIAKPVSVVDIDIKSIKSIFYQGKYPECVYYIFRFKIMNTKGLIST